MAKTITRQTLNLFGATGASTNFAEFGSQAASAPVKTKTIATIQALAAYADGWQSAVALGNAPYLEDMNALFYLNSYQQCYMLQEGTPEFDTGTTYYIGSLVKRTGTSEIYMSLTDTNLNNALPTAGASNTNWQFVFGIISSLFKVGAKYSGAIKGVIDGSSAAAGDVGERIVSLGAAPAIPASGVWGDCTSISLTAGDWELCGAIAYDRSVGGTWSSTSCGISVSSGNNSTGLNIGDTWSYIGWAGSIGTAVNDTHPSVNGCQISVSVTTTVYLKMQVAYTVGTPVINGSKLIARRAR